ncbi:hypothetical protein PF002_g26313 [Phytophthora fragariae]|uniref:Integrase catalytic domain-containing protein n=1 Tax=Phytophthora fragariae TaxID=53985 RepID=A0A6A3WH40_9STRA|nr:hypothetical protein PF002_g26313 [Phytophthora fragariae]
MLAGQALQRQRGRNVHSPEEIQELKALNRLEEVLRPQASSPEMAAPASLDADNLDAKNLDAENLDAENGDAGTRGTDDPVGTAMDAGRGKAQVLAVTTRSAAARTTTRMSQPPDVLEELVVQRLRLDRIRVAQAEEVWIVNLKKYLRGDVGDLSRREVKNCQKLAPQYEEGESGLLYYQSRNDDSAEGRDEMMKLVIPETLREDVLHHYHASLEGGHQGIGRTYRRGESPGNIVATYPFQIIAMDHIPSLPASYKGNTELLVWVDLFTGFVVVKANASRTSQTVAEAYEEAVFRRFGASEAIRHDREPGFMSDFFKAFSKLMGQRQRATLAYRPQANGAAERMVQTVTRAIKMYIADVDQRDWDEYAERLTFALYTSHDRTRNETPFFLVHGWDPRSTLEATLALGNTSTRDAEARRWRLRIQRHYKVARAQALELVREAVEERARRQTERATQHEIATGSQVWLYLDRVKPGYARKLAHMWHGPFRVAELVSAFAVRLETAGIPVATRDAADDAGRGASRLRRGAPARRQLGGHT